MMWGSIPQLFQQKVGESIWDSQIDLLTKYAEIKKKIIPFSLLEHEIISKNIPQKRKETSFPCEDPSVLIKMPSVVAVDVNNNIAIEQFNGVHLHRVSCFKIYYLNTNKTSR